MTLGSIPDRVRDNIYVCIHVRTQPNPLVGTRFIASCLHITIYLALICCILKYCTFVEQYVFMLGTIVYIVGG